MKYIAVCDSHPEYRRHVVTLLRRFLALYPQYHVGVVTFSQGEALLSSPLPLALCILSGELEENRGLEVASQYGQGHPDISFILYTSQGSPNQALEAFQLGAAQYILKPVEQKNFWLALRGVLEGKPALRSKRAAIRSTAGLTNVLLSELIYAKSTGHRITFTLRGGRQLKSKCLRISFGCVVEPLLTDGFLRCHDSYTLNLAHARRLTPEGVLMSDGTTLPVSTKKRPLLRQLLDNRG